MFYLALLTHVAGRCLPLLETVRPLCSFPCRLTFPPTVYDALVIPHPHTPACLAAISLGVMHWSLVGSEGSYWNICFLHKTLGETEESSGGVFASTERFWKYILYIHSPSSTKFC